MRKTKCKSCNGHGMIVKDDCQKQAPQCSTCQGTGEISVYTIQELREGKVWCENDGTQKDLQKVISKAFPDDDWPEGVNTYYYGSGDHWFYNKTKGVYPTQSVKIFLEEIEQEEEYKPTEKQIERAKNFREKYIEEPEFKWGEQVEASMNEDFLYYVTGTYCSKDPITHGLHIVTTGSIVDSFLYIRKPQKITLTLSQIAEKFNYDRDKINVDLEK